VDWLFTANAELALAVAFARKVMIYARARRHDVLVRDFWLVILDVEIPA
jgi:hypothetical protein